MTIGLPVSALTKSDSDFIDLVIWVRWLELNFSARRTDGLAIVRQRGTSGTCVAGITRIMTAIIIRIIGTNRIIVLAMMIVYCKIAEPLEEYLNKWLTSAILRRLDFTSIHQNFTDGSRCRWCRLQCFVNTFGTRRQTCSIEFGLVEFSSTCRMLRLSSPLSMSLFC